MYKSLLTALISIGLAGCQLDQSLLKPGQSACSPLADKIDHWLILESEYQQSDSEERQELLKQVTENKDTAILALLLSQPENNTAQLKQSLELFNSLRLDKEPECDAEQYLWVRYQYTQSVMVLQRALNAADMERKQLAQESKKLQLQVEALTKIEKDLSSQKEGEE